MILRLLFLGGVVAMAIRCGGETPPPSRKLPKHPDGGTPEFDDDEDSGPSVDAAREQLGRSFDLFVHATREERYGCGIIRVQDIVYTGDPDAEKVYLRAEGRWGSFPKSLGSDQVAMNVAYRSGDFPLSSITSDYPDYGTLGLSYLVTGTLDLTLMRLALVVENIDLKAGEPSGIFLAAAYESDSNSCLPDESLSNEFFVATPSEEVMFENLNSGTKTSLCPPCDPPVEEIRLEIVR